ncbi:hypothetical protein HBI72_085130 [Parastagonospora nodorum]|nr:hypothetical protein HBI72_085130 [Parastagonospora nodorum]
MGVCFDFRHCHAMLTQAPDEYLLLFKPNLSKLNDNALFPTRGFLRSDGSLLLVEHISTCLGAVCQWNTVTRSLLRPMPAKTHWTFWYRTTTQQATRPQRLYL